MVWVWLIDPEVAVTVRVVVPAGVPGYLLLLPQPLSERVATAPAASRRTRLSPRRRRAYRLGQQSRNTPARLTAPAPWNSAGMEVLADC